MPDRVAQTNQALVFQRTKLLFVCLSLHINHPLHSTPSLCKDDCSLYMAENRTTNFKPGRHENEPKKFIRKFFLGKNTELICEITERFYFKNSGNIRFLRHGTFKMLIFHQLLKDIKNAHKIYTNPLTIVATESSYINKQLRF